ncbi:MAG: DNA mismatch repair endonuclease MutL [Deltaproteobacteria bacterium]|nr:DNA mismatch repair endonuclease MutL [Deltaproteobacteria bacterium]
MGKIHLLEDHVINKIAAGEVVERPASVVKELVENALDAGATQIDVNLEMGGLRSIAVTDNGGGMSGEDAALALRRHATSKIRDADQLFSISSMGFRGEALASIAAVSQFSLATREVGQRTGTKITVTGEEAPQTLPWSGPEGTTVAVENLFYNVPVRAKFLKSPATEFSHILELMQSFALCRPTVGFSVRHNGRDHLRVSPLVLEAAPWFGEQVLRERSRVVVGKDGDQLVYVRTSGRFGEVEALVSPPGLEKATSKSLYTFVNGRMVKDKVLRYGVLRGYHSHLMKGKFPAVVLHLRTDPSLVDVNVHPAKTEVRFQYPDEVQNLIALGIRDKMRAANWAGAGTGTDHVTGSVVGSMFGNRVGVTAEAASSPRSPLPAMASARPFAAPRMTLSTRADGDLATSMRMPSTPVGGPVFDKASIDRLLETPTIVERPTAVPAINWGELRFLGAFAQCYLLFTDQERMLVVDQHAFHERIIYERLVNDESLLHQSQRLLVPEAVELSPATVALLGERRQDLKGRGFEYGVESTTTVLVKAVPSLLAGRDVIGLFEHLGDGLKDIYCERPGGTEPADSNAELMRLLLASVACHAAVRAGEDLPANEVRQLLAEASTVDFYHNCPHGRRVLRWWHQSQVAQWFDR